MGRTCWKSIKKQGNQVFIESNYQIYFVIIVFTLSLSDLIRQSPPFYKHEWTDKDDFLNRLSLLVEKLKENEEFRSDYAAMNLHARDIQRAARRQGITVCSILILTYILMILFDFIRNFCSQLTTVLQFRLLSLFIFAILTYNLSIISDFIRKFCS